MSKPKNYKHIKAWGKYLSSFDYYIERQQEIALKENAPINAIYKDKNGQWKTFDDIKSRATKDDIERLLLSC